MNKLLLFLSIFIVSSFVAKSDLCEDFLLWDGSEPIKAYGMDSTFNWWAITEPFNDRYRLVVNGIESETYLDLTTPVFSPGGNRWATFVNYNGLWDLMTEDTIYRLNASKPGEVTFSTLNEKIAYSYFEGDLEQVVIGENKYDVFNRTGRLIISPWGNSIAFAAERGSYKVVNINGRESDQYDDIIPAGFWHDGKFVYAVQNGFNWEIMKGEEPMSDDYKSVNELIINYNGTVMGASIVGFDERARAILFSDEYYEPLIGRSYDAVSDVALHPHLPLIAYNAEEAGNFYVVFSNTEYFASRFTRGIPMFTHDGSEMYFFGCNIDCFININGKRYDIPTVIDVQSTYVVEPGTKTVAFTTTSSLVVRFLETNMLHSGMMVDACGPPRYNWRDDRYEAIGRISERLYLLTCRAR